MVEREERGSVTNGVSITSLGKRAGDFLIRTDYASATSFGLAGEMQDIA